MKIFVPISALLILSALAPLPGAAQERVDKPAHFVVDASAALVGAAVQRLVDRTEPVEEEIQETPVCGVGRTVGSVHAELVPDGRRATVDIVFRGSVASRTVGSRGNIRIHTATTTPFEVRRRIMVDETGIQSCDGPARALAATTLLGITSTMDFDAMPRQFAREVYKRNEGAAEAETSVKTARKLAAGLRNELATPLASASQTVNRELQSYRRAGLKLEAIGFSTTEAFLEARLRFDLPNRPQPERLLPLPPNVDLAMRIHESAANEAAQTEFGGRAFRLEGVSKIYDDLTRGLIHDGRPGAVQKAGLKKIEKALADLAGKPVTITLAQTDPVNIAFTDAGFNVTFRIAGVRQENTIYAGLTIKAVYRFENLKAGVQSARVGPIQFTAQKPEPDQKIAALPAQFLFLLESLAAEVVTERLVLNPLPLPAAITDRLQPPRAYAADGWFALTWTLARGP